MKGVVRRGNHDSRREVVLPNQASDAGSRDNACRKKCDTVIREAGGKLRGNVGPGFARIHSDQDARLCICLQKVLAERPRDSVKSGVVQWVRAGNASNAVRTE